MNENEEREQQLKNNWEELQKWNLQKEEQMKEKYGADITKLAEEKSTKAMNKVADIINKIGKVMFIALIIAQAIIIVLAYVVLIAYFVNIRQMQTMASSNSYSGFHDRIFKN